MVRVKKKPTVLHLVVLLVLGATQSSNSEEAYGEDPFASLDSMFGNKDINNLSVDRLGTSVDDVFKTPADINNPGEQKGYGEPVDPARNPSNQVKNYEASTTSSPATYTEPLDPGHTNYNPPYPNDDPFLQISTAGSPHTPPTEENAYSVKNSGPAESAYSSPADAGSAKTDTQSSGQVYPYTENKTYQGAGSNDASNVPVEYVSASQVNDEQQSEVKHVLRCARDCYGKENSRYADCEYCNRFVTCLDGSLKYHACPHGYFYNYAQGRCEYDDNHICVPHPTTSPSPLPPSKTNDAHDSGRFVWIDNSVSDVCTVTCKNESGYNLPSGQYPHCVYCDAFAQCTSGVLAILPCPKRTYYNKNLGVCDHDGISQKCVPPESYNSLLRVAGTSQDEVGYAVPEAFAQQNSYPPAAVQQNTYVSTGALNSYPPRYQPTAGQQNSYPPSNNPPTVRQPNSYPPNYQPAAGQQNSYPPSNKPSTRQDNTYPPNNQPSGRQQINYQPSNQQPYDQPTPAQYGPTQAPYQPNPVPSENSAPYGQTKAHYGPNPTPYQQPAAGQQNPYQESSPIVQDPYQQPTPSQGTYPGKQAGAPSQGSYPGQQAGAPSQGSYPAQQAEAPSQVYPLCVNSCRNAYGPESDGQFGLCGYCNVYVKCYRGKSQTFYCDDGYQYDVTIGQCVVDTKGECTPRGPETYSRAKDDPSKKEIYDKLVELIRAYAEQSDKLEHFYRILKEITQKNDDGTQPEDPQQTLYPTPTEYPNSSENPPDPYPSENPHEYQNGNPAQGNDPHPTEYPQNLQPPYDSQHYPNYDRQYDPSSQAYSPPPEGYQPPPQSYLPPQPPEYQQYLPPPPPGGFPYPNPYAPENSQYPQGQDYQVQPPPGYSPQPYGPPLGYTAPADPYGAQPGYPAQPNYAAPYGTQPGYTAPAGPYGAPPGYGAPADPYGAPPGYAAPADPYGAPPGYAAPADPYGAPPRYAAPPQPAPGYPGDPYNSGGQPQAPYYPSYSQ